MKQLLEKMVQFAGQAVGQKPGEQWKGDDPNPPGKKLVGDSILKDLNKGLTPKTKEQELAEEWATFNEEDLGVNPKRPGRKGSRHSRGHEPTPRYKKVKADEGRMSELDIELQDYHSMSDEEFKAAYNTTKTEWMNKNKSLVIKHPNLRKGLGITEEYNDDEDEGFFVAIGSEEDGGFVGMICKDGGKWRESSITGTAPHNWGGGYMSYLTPEEVMDWIKKDYHRGYDVAGPFYSEGEAREHAQIYYGNGLDEGMEGFAKAMSAKRKAARDNKTDAYKRGWNDGLADEFDDTHRGNKEYEKGSYDGVDHASSGPKGWGRANPKRYDMAEGWESGGNYEGTKRRLKNSDPFVVVDKTLGAVICTSDSLDEAKKQAVEWAEYDDINVVVIQKDTQRSVFKVNGYADAEKYLDEGWESGPDEYVPRERDPDAEYDAMRQEKLDTEMFAQQDKRPQTKVYTLTGRGPNMEPNYTFPGEYATQDEAAAAREKLAADPSTPNPRMIGINKHTKYLDEGTITSSDTTESAVLSAVQDLIQQGHTEVAPEVITNMVVAATSQPFLLKDLVDANNKSQAIQHYIDSINPTKVKFSSDILTVKNEDPMKEKQVAQNGVAKMAAKAANRSRLGEGENNPRTTNAVPARLAEIAAKYDMLSTKLREFKESRGHKAVATKLDNMDRMQNVQIPTPAERREQIRIAKEKEQALKGKSKVDEYGANSTSSQGTAALNQQIIDPKQVQATQALKASTGSTASTTNIAKALDSASQGKTVAQQDMKAIEPLMKDVATISTDPKLAGQFKSILNQVQQIQRKT